MDMTNTTFDELTVGDGIEVSRLVTARDVELFAVVSGDHNPLHLDPEYAAPWCDRCLPIPRCRRC